MIQQRMLQLLLLGQLLAGPGPFCAALATVDQLTVCPPSVGCLKGTNLQGYQSERFEAFMGIPYALPPIGDLRFSNPKVMPKLLGMYDASAPKMDCIQKNYLLPTPVVYGDEDCLYLNVYRPEIRKSALPVMVYIHGGGFFGGSAGPGVTGPEYFMDSGEVILVTMAYRLGPFGFLSTQDAVMSGNFGLKDQNLALRWVQRNIRFFGGDPQRVTIFGQSAGGVAAHMHLLSPRSHGLFHRVISMSGTANVPFAIAEQPLEQARLLAEFADVPDARNLSTVKLTKALRRINATKLLNAGDGLKYWDVDHMTNFRPVVEEGLEVDAFLNAHPMDMLAQGMPTSIPLLLGTVPGASGSECPHPFPCFSALFQVLQEANAHIHSPASRHCSRCFRKRMPTSIPLLLGTVPGEGAVRVVNILGNETLRQSFNLRFDELLQELLEFPASFSQDRREKMMDLLVEVYFQGQHEVNELTVQGFMNLISDRGFKQPLYNTIHKNVCHTPNPVYLYSFNYQGPLSYASAYTSANVTGKYGVVHCDDLLYLFRSPLLFPDFQRNSTEAKVIHSFVDYFVHFAKFGKPRNSESLTPCSIEVLQSRPDGICDYHEFANAPDAYQGFEVHVASEFQTDRVNLWSHILNEK
uniref:Carboxylic ester hydrolase n=1 Tax=Drosophila melanogaster TaxID=7227 RepID=Q3ZAK4_DROME|nr:IP02848p [Drosophila melanogaster]